MNKYKHINKIVLLLLGLFVQQLAFSQKQKKPNIILLFADDAGYHDFGFQGNQNFSTPELDKMASKGVRFSQMYVSASVCGPSRAGLLTGIYQQRFGFEENNVPGIMSKSGLTGEDMGLPLGIKTIGNYLQDLGYRTAVFGKWHMGEADRYHPTKRGFDEFYGFRGGARSFFAYNEKQKEKRGKGHWMERGFGDFQEHEGYLTNVLADETCDFIERHKDKPFFAYVSFNAVHLPIQIDPQDKDTFPYLEGKRRKGAQMTLSLDRACGQIMKKLEELGLDENTIIVFSNDNGGPTDRNASSNYPFSGVKGTHLEGGIRVPGFMIWKEHINQSSVYDKAVSILDLVPTFVEAAGGNAVALEGLDGVDLLPYVQGKNKQMPHESLYWKKENRGTILDGKWKLMRFPDRPAHLFDIEKDPAEQENLAAKYPDKVKALYKKLFEWELGLERPIFQLRTAEEKWSADRFDQFRKPPAKEY